LSYLLDTNVISEWVKPRPDPKVARWLAEADEDGLWLSAVTFAEIRLGVEEMAPGKRREALSLWLRKDLPERFYGRIIAMGLGVCEAWGVVMARAKKSGITLGAMDGFFAATAQVRGLTFVTRNTKHFDKLGIQLLNPWTETH
jgi:toxin FitB